MADEKPAEATTDKPAAAAPDAPTADAKLEAKPAAAATKDGAKTDKNAQSMHVRVSSPFKVFFDDDALSMSGENATGPFDILPRHHNFISLLNECELAVRTHSGITRVRISGGIMHVKADQVVVFLNV